MTNPTPHGQVPEALIDLIDAYAETRHRCGGIYNAKTEAARKAVIEALSEVQALSAAPAVPAGWKAVPVNPTPEMWKAAKTVPDPNPPCPPHYGLVWDAMLAASPTPPAEQQAAPKAAPTLPEGWTDCTIEFGNDGPEVVAYGPKRMMTRLAKWLGKYFAQVIAEAAPKAAPGEQDDHQILAITTAYEQGVGKGHQAYNSGKEIANPYSPAYRCDLAWQYGYKEGKEQAQREAKAAPKQEAQEPCGWTTGITWRPDTRLQSEQVIKITRDTQPKYGYTTPIYTAPQPAPLSEMPYEKRKAIQEGEQISASDAWFHARHNMLDTLDRRNVFRAGFDRGWNAALDAQGGK